jgi:hypothetical protein
MSKSRQEARHQPEVAAISGDEYKWKGTSIPETKVTLEHERPFHIGQNYILRQTHDKWRRQSASRLYDGKGNAVTINIRDRDAQDHHLCTNKRKNVKIHLS